MPLTDEIEQFLSVCCTRTDRFPASCSRWLGEVTTHGPSNMCIVQGKSKFLLDVEQVQRHNSASSASEWILAQRSIERPSEAVSATPLFRPGLNSNVHTGDTPEPSRTSHVMTSLPGAHTILQNSQERNIGNNTSVVPQKGSLYPPESQSHNPTGEASHTVGFEQCSAQHQLYKSALQQEGSAAAHCHCKPGNGTSSDTSFTSVEPATNVRMPAPIDLPDPQRVFARPASAHHRSAQVSEITRLEPVSRAPDSGGYGVSQQDSSDFLGGFTLPTGAGNGQSTLQTLKKETRTSFLPQGSLQQQTVGKASRKPLPASHSQQPASPVSDTAGAKSGVLATEPVFSSGAKPWLTQPHLGVLGNMYCSLPGSVASQCLQPASYVPAPVRSPTPHTSTSQYLSNSSATSPGCETFPVVDGSSSVERMSSRGLQSASGTLGGRNQPRAARTEALQGIHTEGVAARTITLDSLDDGSPRIAHGGNRDDGFFLGDLHGTSRQLRRRTNPSTPGQDTTSLP